MITRCSRSTACRRYSNFIFILDLTHGFNGLGKDNRKTRRETYKFGDSVRLILDVYFGCGYRSLWTYHSFLPNMITQHCYINCGLYKPPFKLQQVALIKFYVDLYLYLCSKSMLFGIKFIKLQRFCVYGIKNKVILAEMKNYLQWVYST